MKKLKDLLKRRKKPQEIAINLKLFYEITVKNEEASKVAKEQIFKAFKDAFGDIEEK